MGLVALREIVIIRKLAVVPPETCLLLADLQQELYGKELAKQLTK
jgi:hypothetical protein